MSRYKKPLIIVFFVLNLLAIFHANRPQYFAVENFFPESKQLEYRIRQAHWVLAIYAHLLGLDNRWEMFSYMYHDDWKLLFRAKFKEDAGEVPLPLAQQSDRSFLEEWFFDFRDAKIRLNMFGEKSARESYEKFLCREYARWQNKNIEYVACDLDSRPLLPRAEAQMRQDHYSGERNTTRFDQTPCL